MSSKRAIRRRSCKGKVRHASHEHAVIALVKTVRGGANGHMSAYRCRFCGGWHIGHTPGQERFR